MKEDLLMHKKGVLAAEDIRLKSMVKTDFKSNVTSV
jgi:hypothetical protein